MYVPTYKQVMVLIVGLLLAIATIAKISRIHGASRSAVAHSGNSRATGDLSVPALRLKTGDVLAVDQSDLNTHAHDIWYSWIGSDKWKHAKSTTKLELSAFCDYVKNTISIPEGMKHVASMLWYLSLDKDKFANFREQRIKYLR